jgi:hypothetical protein
MNNVRRVHAQFYVPVVLVIVMGSVGASGCQTTATLDHKEPLQQALSQPERQPDRQPNLQSERRATPTKMVRTELVFGTGRSSGADVSDWHWRAFVNEEVTPRFPQGLTILPADGQWQDKNGTIVRERSWMLVIMHPGSSEADKNIDAIRDAYKKRFNQDSVMRSDEDVKVSF